MGRQVRFFMDTRDERQFMEFVRTTGDVIILPYWSREASPSPVGELPDPLSEQFEAFLWLFNRSVSSALETSFVQEQNRFTINRDKSSVIEFSRTIHDNHILRPGRLWVEFKYVGVDGDWVSKEPEFRQWYEQLVKWIRKHYSRQIDPDFYFGPGATELVRSGEVEVRDY
jgi:hypothetical protein